MMYSDLTDEQRELVAYLFADTAFQTDPACFDYEVNRNGEIVRIPFPPRTELKGGKRKSDIHISAAVEPHPTTDMIRNVEFAFSGLADVIVRRVMSDQQQQEISIDQ